jgi:hypothetical protein
VSVICVYVRSGGAGVHRQLIQDPSWLCVLAHALAAEQPDNQKDWRGQLLAQNKRPCAVCSWLLRCGCGWATRLGVTNWLVLFVAAHALHNPIAYWCYQGHAPRCA